MRIDIITVLPEMIEGFFNYSIMSRAQKKGIAEIHIHNLRDYAYDRYRKVDDYPFGGCAGMVMKIEPIDRCISALKAERCKPLATLQTKKNMSDQIIFDVDGLIEAQIRQRDKDYAKVCCQNLLNYAYGKGLLCDNPCDNEGNLIMPSIIKESSLTEIGKHIFVELLFKWFAYTDNESGKIDRKK